MGIRYNILKHLIEGRHTKIIQKIIKERILSFLFFQKYMFFGALFGSYIYINYSYQIFGIGCEWPPLNLYYNKSYRNYHLHNAFLLVYVWCLG